MLEGATGRRSHRAHGSGWCNRTDWSNGLDRPIGPRAPRPVPRSAPSVPPARLARSAPPGLRRAQSQPGAQGAIGPPRDRRRRQLLCAAGRGREHREQRQDPRDNGIGRQHRRCVRPRNERRHGQSGGEVLRLVRRHGLPTALIGVTQLFVNGVGVAGTQGQNSGTGASGAGDANGAAVVNLAAASVITIRNVARRCVPGRSGNAGRRRLPARDRDFRLAGARRR